MVALYTVWYNFVKMHKSIGMTPALAPGVCDTLWSTKDCREKKPGRKPKQAS